MNKQKPNLRSTLNKKVPLNKNEKELSSIESSINSIHHPDRGDIIRTTILLPMEIHTKIKLYCVKHGISLKEYVTDILIQNTPLE